MGPHGLAEKAGGRKVGDVTGRVFSLGPGEEDKDDIYGLPKQVGGFDRVAVRRVSDVQEHHIGGGSLDGGKHIAADRKDPRDLIADLTKVFGKEVSRWWVVIDNEDPKRSTRNGHLHMVIMVTRCVLRGEVRRINARTW
jgi:hypothetical protein